MDTGKGTGLDQFKNCKLKNFLAIPLRIFLASSVLHLRQHVLRFLSWLSPKNTRGILVTVILMALGVRRFTSDRARLESDYRRKFWRNVIRSATSYSEWAYASNMIEREMPKMNEGDLYDEKLVREKLVELRRCRKERTLRDVMFCLRSDLVRNFGNMCNPLLHQHNRLQAPKLINEYIEEVSTQLKMVCSSNSNELLLEEKLIFMRETRHSFGRTALLLSGGASLGAFHIGVVRTLFENKLMPRIIAGSSVGSIMSAIVATRSRPELESFFQDSLHSLRFFDQTGGIFAVVQRIMTLGAVHDIRQLQRLMRNLTTNLTFKEAYQISGRVLAITVCSTSRHEPPRCLNYLTSPNVLIWSAVTASCAFPGIFEAQELMAKDPFGKIVPFHVSFSGGEDGLLRNSARRWRDGSLESDLPMTQLKELFNVNHFIVSQANPHITPLLRLKEIVRTYGGNFAAKVAHVTEMEIKHRCNQILELDFRLGGVTKIFVQDWEGDITMVMPATLAQYSKIIQNLSYPEVRKAQNQGMRCTWEKLSAIKTNCGIELELDECLALLDRKRQIKKNVERAPKKISPSRRTPLEGSLQEDDLENVRMHRSMYDGIYNEFEASNFDSWTRAGNPLMRTASTSKLSKYVHNLGFDLELDEGLIGSAKDRNTDEYYTQRMKLAAQDQIPCKCFW